MKTIYLKRLITIITVIILLINIVSADTIHDSLNNSIDKTTTVIMPEKKHYKIYKFDIKEEIAPSIWRKVKKAFKEAYEINADIMLIHMNTYGGALDNADSIRTKILHSKIPVYVFIDNNAASAGALISIACDSIYMRSGASMGAATVVDQRGEPVPDKYQSYMRSMMRSTAETNGRNPDIAQAMVDPRIHIEGVIDSGSVLTLTTSEAIAQGFCEGQAESVTEVLKCAGITDYEITEQHVTALDNFIGFLTRPIVSGILIVLIIGGIYFEVQSPGIGFALFVAIAGALLYFAPLYLEGLAANWEILIFVAGLVLILLEIFVIPGFGVAGISGIILVIAGLSLSMMSNTGFDFTHVSSSSVLKSFAIVVIALFSSIIASFYVTQKLFTTTMFGGLALTDRQVKEEGYTIADKAMQNTVGKTGIAYTILRPAGKVMIDNDVYDATAETGYIDKDEPVEVVKHENAQLTVRKINR